MTHTHRAMRRSAAYPFTGPVRVPGERAYNERAHGGACITETCNCGAARRVNVSAGYREVGLWSAPE